MAAMRLLIRAVKSDGQSLYSWRRRREIAAYGGRRGDSCPKFVWPLKVGAVVQPECWTPSDMCGDGLHGIAPREVSGELISAWSNASWFPKDKWIVFRGDTPVRVMGSNGKYKCSRAEVLFVGTLPDALRFMKARNACTLSSIDTLIKYLTDTLRYRYSFGGDDDERNRQCRHVTRLVEQLKQFKESWQP